jgi:hypothetical protein
VACPETGIITGEQLTRAAGKESSDAAVAAALLAAGNEPAEVYGDSAYGTGDLRAALKETGHTAVIKSYFQFCGQRPEACHASRLVPDRALDASGATVKDDVPDYPCHGDGHPSTLSRKSDSRRSGGPGFCDSRR